MSSVFSRITSNSGLMETAFSFFYASQSKINILFVILFTCLSAWISGQFIWIVYDEQSAVSIWSAKSTNNGAISQNTNNYDVSKLLESDLFGRYSEVVEEEPETTPIVVDAPETRLNLILVGAVSSSDSDSSLAVIANRGSQSTYGIDETIEGTQATLKRVFIDRVIINNAGRDETLMLAGAEYTTEQNQETRSASTTRSSGRPSDDVGNNPSATDATPDDLDVVKAEILKQPQKILEYIRLSQVNRDGSLIGYRVSPGRDRTLFDSVGLQVGDIATAFNGEDLTDPESMTRLWQAMPNMTEVTLTVERDGQDYEIYVTF